MKRTFSILFFSIFLFSACSFLRSDDLYLNESNPLIDFYRGPLGSMEAVRSGSCPMFPSCSDYALELSRKRSFFEAYFLTFDRLLRCGRDTYHPHNLWIKKGEEYYLSDPVF